MALSDAHRLVDAGMDSLEPDEAAAQTFTLLDTASEVGAALYSIGFLGVKDTTTGVVAFCHDGRLLDRELKANDRVMVHPCYWMALGIRHDDIQAGQAEEIFDDYEIRVVSKSPEVLTCPVSSDH